MRNHLCWVASQTAATYLGYELLLSCKLAPQLLQLPLRVCMPLLQLLNDISVLLLSV